MKIDRKILATAIGTLLLLLGCSFVQHQKTMAVDPASPSPMLDDPRETADERLLEANAKFSFKLFEQLQKQHQDQKNIFISPTSIVTALSLLLQGAGGETQQEMQQALELQGLTLSEINRAHQTLRRLLETGDPDVRLAIANSLWMRQGVAFKPEFLQTNRDYYAAEVTELDFTQSDAPDRINTWVKENTNSKIEKIVETIKPDEILFLLNAIYFKGNWTEKFDPEKTKEKAFFLSEDSGINNTIPVKMMSQTGEYRYLENEQFQAVSLPYGKEGRFSLYIFLPRPDSNLNAFFQQLTAENWQTWMQRFSLRDGNLEIPRFKLEYEVQLENVLAALGMKNMFEANAADFSKMTDESVAVSQVKHKTFVEVNEEGTEAAAVTSIGVRTTSMPPPPFQMMVNRPFFLALRDNSTREVLFMGAIREP